MKMCYSTNLWCSASALQRQFFFATVYIIVCIFCGTTTTIASAQLLINVQNQGGEVVQETITPHLGEDRITLEFQRTDGTLITQLLDFRNEVLILKALVLGEEERGQSQYQVMCFVTKLNRSDFISADAMAKLRQKNPSTIRQPEEDRGRENFTMTGWVNLERSTPISRHIAALCSEAADSTYIRDADIRTWASMPGSSMSSLESAIHSFPSSSSSAATTTTPSRCNDVSGLWTPCTCQLEMCIGWYPCGLKFCKGKVDTSGGNNGLNGNNASYRCGIKTCRKCNQFAYYVQQKQQCLWDD